MAESTNTSKTHTSRRGWPRGDRMTLIGIVIGLVGVIATLLAVPEFRQLIGLDPHVKSSLEKVESLAVGVNISVYQNDFGQSTFINYPKSPTGKIQEKEYIFVNTDFYLDAVTDTNDSVLYYAVTVRNDSFHPVFKGPSPITLGVSKFTDITGEPNFVVACSFEGAKFSYYETHYYGYSGDYQDYGFGVNPAGDIHSGPQFLEDLLGLEQSGYCPGVGPVPGATIPPGAGPPPLPTQQVNALKNDIRSNTVINTYAVSTETIKDLNGSSYLGVDYDQVRQLGSQ
jgi:hypothetical protein